MARERSLLSLVGETRVERPENFVIEERLEKL
jgi:hypothetical protein